MHEFANTPGESTLFRRTGRICRLLVLSGLCWGGSAAWAVVYTVTTTGDTVGTCTPVAAGASQCTTLRGAIAAANGSAGVPDSIVFSPAIANSSIVVSSALPNISDTLIIDGQANNITVDGNGQLTRILTYGGSAGSQLLNMIFTNSQGGLVTATGTADLTFRGNIFTQPSGVPSASAAASCINCANFLFDNNKILSFPKNGLILSGGSAASGYAATVTNSTFTANSIGVDLQSQSNTLVDRNTMTGNSENVRLLGNSSSNTITNNLMNAGAYGIRVLGSAGIKNFNLIQGNSITGADQGGIQFQVSSGGEASQNTITGNTITGTLRKGGVLVEGGPAMLGNAIYNNVIRGNAGLGIDLGTLGPDLNDTGDTDTGANMLQNYPVFTSIIGSQVNFTLDTQPNANGFRIDFYNNPGGVDPSGYGEGEAFLGFCIVTNPSATVPSTCTVAGASATTLRATATLCQAAGCSGPSATLSIGSTSEFNRGSVVDLAISKTDNQTTYVPGGSHIYDIVVSNNGPSTVDNAVFTDPAIANLTIAGLVCGAPVGGAICPTGANITVALMQGAGIVIPLLPAGGSVTFTVAGGVNAGATGNLVNVASIATPAGVVDSTPANGAILRDKPISGLSCTTAPSCSATGGASCPSALLLTAATLTSTAGVAIPILPNGGGVTVTLSCLVTATGQ